MSFIDKIVNSVRLNDSYDDQEEFLADDEYEEEEEDSRVGFGARWHEKRAAKKEKKLAEKTARDHGTNEKRHGYPEEKKPLYSFREEDEEEETEDVEEEREPFDRSGYRKPGFLKKRREESARDAYEELPREDYARPSEKQPQEKVYHEKPRESSPNLKITPLPRKVDPNMEVKVIRPTSMESSREIADSLLTNSTVLLNLEGLDMDVAQRIIDFTCGTCYSLSGRLQKISNYIFILTPEEVDISGDVTSMLEGNFDIPTMRSQY